MSRSLKVLVTCIVALAILMVGIFLYYPLQGVRANHHPAAEVHSAATTSPDLTATQQPLLNNRPTQAANKVQGTGSTPKNHPPTVTAIPPTQVATHQHLSRNIQAQGPYKVQGNVILAADGKSYLFHGVGRDGLEYACLGDGHFDAKELSYIGSGTNTYAITYWGANTVRLPLSEGFWVNGQSSTGCSAAQYQSLVKKTVDTLTALKLNVIIDLQWSDAGGQSLQGGGPWAMPDADSVTFWQQAAGIYSSYTNVLFELFNEPHPHDWSCWATACSVTDTAYSDDCHCTKTLTFQSVGMQAVINAVRGTGATNLVLVAGVNWGYDLSQIAANPLTGSNIVYDTHPYPYAGKQPQNWDASFGTISATYPVISAESGEYDCGTSYMSQLLSYFDAHQIGWMAWAWVVQGDPCTYPQLIQNYQGMPTPGMGQLIYQRLHGYA